MQIHREKAVDIPEIPPSIEEESGIQGIHHTVIEPSSSMYVGGAEEQLVTAEGEEATADQYIEDDSGKPRQLS